MDHHHITDPSLENWRFSWKSCDDGASGGASTMPSAARCDGDLTISNSGSLDDLDLIVAGHA
jgi:hypothetical protein